MYKQEIVCDKCGHVIPLAREMGVDDESYVTVTTFGEDHYVLDKHLCLNCWKTACVYLGIGT